MPYEQRDNSGSLFPNDRKTTDNHPDRQGSARIVCPNCNVATEYWLSGWVKAMKQKSGNWLSLAFNVKEPKSDIPDPGEEPVPVKGTARHPSEAETDDDIPF